MILRNQGVSRYLSPHRAPSEAEEALSFSPALTIWCFPLSLSGAGCSLSRSPFLCLALSFVGPSPKPGIASRDAPSGRDRAATFSNLVPALRKPLSFGPSHRLPTTARVFPASALLRSLSFHSSPPLPLFFPSAQMEASWRQVAGGRGRARGRATAAPSSGNGIHLRGAGGGRGKGSVGAGGPGCSPGGAATAAAAGTAAPRDLKHRGLP